MLFALCFIGALPFALCFPAEAQEPKKLFRIGYLSGTDRATDSPRAEGIRTALREAGYIEGQNVIIEYRHAEGRRERYPALAADLVRLNVDLIVIAGGEGLIRDAKDATKTIPIVMMGPGLDPIKAGLVESLARPGGNVTGLTTLNTELGGKRLELLKETVPKIARVAALYAAISRGATREVKEYLPVAARALGLTIHPWELRDTEDLERVFAALIKERPDGLYVPLSSILRANAKRIVGLTVKNRLPSIYDEKGAVEVGGLMTYSVTYNDLFLRAAIYVDKILKGAKPADLPVEQPTKFEMVINLRAAKQIGLTIPQSLLYRADRVIK
jgi:putative ABC transport system substrate-binding protein